MDNRKFHSLDNVSLGHCKDSRDRTMSNEEDSSYASSDEEGLQITVLERLIRTHPVWFLPCLQRSGAVHLLQGREVGNFIVRSSTQPMTMAVSVKLPTFVEHYLLKAVDHRISLENSTHTFETVHQLVHHYCSTSDEIPVCLTVPPAIAEATSRQQLRSLALLGQEFWTRSTVKELSSPSDNEVSRHLISSGLGSQSSSLNSIPDNGPHRPTTLNLKVPKPPPRWSKSTLLTSVQYTPTDSGTSAIRKKNRSSIHYKDVELFKGKKTNYDDKASDYEDIWSPINKSKPLSTFKPTNRLSLFESKSIYSEPVDSVRFKRFSVHRHSEPNIRWSHLLIQDDNSFVDPASHINAASNGGQDSENQIWPKQTSTEDYSNYVHQEVKFPIMTPPNSPGQRHESYRFSRYDNLEYSKSDDSFLQENTISQPWDSSKWEHLLKVVSDSTLQLNSAKSQIEKNKASKCIQLIVRELAEETNGVFGPTLNSFISCTLSAKCKDPNKIMKNIRQFMNGMKNYLTGTTSKETEELRQEIKKQTELLDEFEFLNIDSILEQVLIDLILHPLYNYILCLLNDTNPCLVMNNHDSFNPELKSIYDQFRDTYSPLNKLKMWSEFVSKAQEEDTYNSENSIENLAADLSKSVSERLHSNVITSVRVVIPDERNGTLVRKIIPIQSSTTNKDVIRVLASKLGISNPNDYVLVSIKNGEESTCSENSQVELHEDQTLAFKRINAKIGWPAKI
ncbi:unnamed protein product [Allacma fusca]|uniref:SH2 domain-containing protein n=1 Tax=Allacma fusca TaxID=39272 RepID=A0A8J2P606_9HEXA|nr:unnamed protein product [Allacma fusca]